MRYWIKKGAFLLGGFVFFVILLSNLIGSDPFDLNYLVPALIRAVLGGALFWFAGFILGDIVFKGVLNDIDENDKSNLLEGGLIQQMHMEKEKHVPGGEEYPYVEEKVTYQKIIKQKKNQLTDMR
jgi:hypothetical protein